MAATYDDGGYWIANSQGTVLACGNARAFGGLTTIPNRPVVGIAATFDGGGYYWSRQTVAYLLLEMQRFGDQLARSVSAVPSLASPWTQLRAATGCSC